MVSIFWSIPNHITLKYRCPIYCCVQFRHVYFEVQFEHYNPFLNPDKLSTVYFEYQLRYEVNNIKVTWLETCLISIEIIKVKNRICPFFATIDMCKVESDLVVKTFETIMLHPTCTQSNTPHHTHLYIMTSTHVYQSRRRDSGESHMHAIAPDAHCNDAARNLLYVFTYNS